MKDFELFGNVEQAQNFLDSVKSGQFLLSFVMSYTQTCEIPGITIAGADSDSMKYTPPADAEYLHYGYCKTIDNIPMTPDGKPTPALLTKTALESASIPHLTINAGSKITPQLPFIETGLSFGKNISIVTFDGPVVESITSPALSAIVHPREQLGIKALEMLLSMDGDNYQHHNFLAKPKLIDRGTVHKVLK